MELFRGQGLVPVEPPRGMRAGYGARTRRRYGRLRPAEALAPDATTMPPGDGDPFPWVDQDFEEYFFD